MDPMTISLLASAAPKLIGGLAGLFGGDEKPYIPPELMQNLAWDKKLQAQIAGLLPGMMNPMSTPMGQGMLSQAEKTAGRRFDTLRTRNRVGMGRKYLGRSSFDTEREGQLRESEGRVFAALPTQIGSEIQSNLYRQLQALSSLQTGAAGQIAGIRSGTMAENQANKAAAWGSLGSLFGAAGTAFAASKGSGKAAALGAIDPGLLELLTSGA